MPSAAFEPAIPAISSGPNATVQVQGLFEWFVDSIQKKWAAVESVRKKGASMYFLERSKEKDYVENDIITNYMKNLMNQTSLTILKSKY